mmetsp:Transcript_26934/g.86575  ORF Transcript_26934/g.86575 Transcript_26934/m.86575 type:complete len:267 (+) Transcript_26934:1589-2389(+)
MLASHRHFGRRKQIIPCLAPLVQRATPLQVTMRPIHCIAHARKDTCGLLHFLRGLTRSVLRLLHELTLCSPLAHAICCFLGFAGCCRCAVLDGRGRRRQARGEPLQALADVAGALLGFLRECARLVLDLGGCKRCAHSASAPATRRRPTSSLALAGCRIGCCLVAGSACFALGATATLAAATSERLSPRFLELLVLVHFLFNRLLQRRKEPTPTCRGFLLLLLPVTTSLAVTRLAVCVATLAAGPTRAADAPGPNLSVPCAEAHMS